ncbi:hypothetical protein [Legionella maceachernii]|nr:hypothetical protein [Legionella maceachernii]
MLAIQSYFIVNIAIIFFDYTSLVIRRISMEYCEILEWLYALKRENSENKTLLALIKKTNKSLDRTVDAKEARNRFIELLEEIITLHATAKGGDFNYPNPHVSAGIILEELRKPSGDKLFISTYDQNLHKICSLTDLLEKYREHLHQVLYGYAEEYFPYKKTILTELRDSSQLKDYPEIALAIDKIKAAEEYLKILHNKETNSSEKLKSFKSAYLKEINLETGEHLFEKRRDTLGIIIAKLVVSLLVVPLFLGIWKVKGQEVDQEVKKISGPFSPPTAV